jgi:transposase
MSLEARDALIRAQRASGTSTAELAKRFNVSQPRIYQVLTHKPKPKKPPKQRRGRKVRVPAVDQAQTVPAQLQQVAYQAIMEIAQQLDPELACRAILAALRSTRDQWLAPGE